MEVWLLALEKRKLRTSLNPAAVQSNFGRKDVAELQTAIASSVSPISLHVYSRLLPFNTLIYYTKCAFKSSFDSRSLALETLC
jgi:hypothetical protein